MNRSRDVYMCRGGITFGILLGGGLYATLGWVGVLGAFVAAFLVTTISYALDSRS